MRLHEWQGKALLARHGVPIPVGRLWSEGLPAVGSDGLVVKAQTLAGGRGVRGGVVVCADAAEARAAAEALIGSRLGDEVVQAVYVEERVPVSREIYVAIAVDREAGTPRLLLGPDGGIDVEREPQRVAGLSVGLGTAIRPFHVRELVRRAGLVGVDPSRLGSIYESLWQAYVVEEAELVEVNPLAVLPSGSLVALDARVILDDAANPRHRDRPAGGELGTPFERRCAELGAVGIETEGDIAAIVSGAGLMMATVDMLVTDGGRVRAGVDLGGLVLREAAELSELVAAIASLRPGAVLVNAFFQLATCDALARGLAAGLEAVPLACPIVVRLRGRGLDEARAILEPHGVIFEPDLPRAIRSVVAAVEPSTVV